MFAILFSDSLAPFWSNVFSFPTLPYTVGLMLCMAFWLVSSLGVLDIDALDLDPDAAQGGPNALAALLVRTGLHGVPVTVVLTLLSLIGWCISYFAVHFAGSLMPSDGIMRYVAGTPVLLASFVAAVGCTRLAVRPLRRLFARSGEVTARQMLGRTAIVRTSKVSTTFGEATLDDGGAGLILKIRAAGDASHELGDRVVLLDFDEDANVYHVISESDYTGG